MFRYARVCGYCLYNPADGLTNKSTGVLRPIESKHYACITEPTAVGMLLRAIDAYHGTISMKYALKIIPYLALRSTELRLAHWSEIDLDAKMWIVPATRAERPQDGGGMKKRIAHEVPLADQVVRLFQELRAFGQPGPLCFPGTRSNYSRPITDNGLLIAVRSMGYGKEDMTVHGFRGTFATLLNEKKLQWNIDGDVIEKQMAHARKNQVEAAYNHAQWMEPRRKMMQLWADYLDSLRTKNEN